AGYFAQLYFDGGAQTLGGTGTVRFAGEVGRASCREGVWVSVVAVGLGIKVGGAGRGAGGAGKGALVSAGVVGGEGEGGTLTGSGVSVSSSSGNVILDGVTLGESLTIPGVNTRVTLQHGLTLDNSADVTAAPRAGYFAQLYFDGGAQTLGGTGTVRFAG